VLRLLEGLDIGIAGSSTTVSLVTPPAPASPPAGGETRT
jgi:hypothetical protein